MPFSHQSALHPTDLVLLHRDVPFYNLVTRTKQGEAHFAESDFVVANHRRNLCQASTTSDCSLTKDSCKRI